jgi:hypothetical protein
MAAWTGRPMPDFALRLVSSSGVAAPEKVSFSTLAAGKPAVLHFYNGG